MHLIYVGTLLATCFISAVTKSAIPPGLATTNPVLVLTTKVRELFLHPLRNSGAQYFLPSVSDALHKDKVIAPALGASSVNVPSKHFVFLGNGGVLPDFEGPFCVDSLHSNYQWGDQIHPVVWVGYFEDRKIAVGAAVDATYTDICQFLVRMKTEGPWINFKKVIAAVYGIHAAFDECMHMVMMRMLVPIQHYFVWEYSQTVAAVVGNIRYVPGSIIYYWLDWFLHWSAVYILTLPWARCHSAHVPKVSSARAYSLVPKNQLLEHGLLAVDTTSAIVFATPLDVLRAAFIVASTSVESSGCSIWQTVYFGHRHAMLQRCVGLAW